MRTIHFAWKFLKKHKFGNVLIIIEIVFALFIFTLLAARYTFSYGTYNDYKNTPIKHSVFFMGREPVLFSEHFPYSYIDVSYMDSLQEELGSFDFIEGISIIGSFSTMTTNDIVFVYDEITASFQKPSINGQWLFEDDGNKENGIVVYNPKDIYTIGDVIELDIMAHNQFGDVNVYDDKPILPQKISSDFKIVGFVDKIKDRFIYSSVQSNQAFSLEEILNEAEHYEEYTIYFIPYSDELFADYKFSTNNFFVYLDENTTHEQVDKLLDVLNDYGLYSFEGKIMLEKTREIAQKTFESDSFMLWTSGGIAILSLLSITFLNVKKLSKYLSIYYLNGCSKKRSMGLYGAYLGLILVISLVSYLGVMKILQYQAIKRSHSGIMLMAYELNLETILIGAIVITLILALGSFMPFWRITKKQNINIWKGN